MIRWQIGLFGYSVRVHHWLQDFDPQHDHPGWFLTFILRGGYTDITPHGEERMTAGKLAFRSATYRHSVKLDKGGCWSFLVFGRETRPNWGYWVNGKFRKRNKYFFEHGQPPCSSAGSAGAVHD